MGQVEVRLRPAVAAERELIEALRAESGPRGAITEVLGECIRRGYRILEEHVVAEAPEGDIGSHAALAAAGQYRFKLLQVFRAAGGAPAGNRLSQSSDGPVPAKTQQGGAIKAAPALAPAVAPEAAEQADDEPSAPKKPDWSAYKGVAGYKKGG